MPITTLSAEFCRNVVPPLAGKVTWYSDTITGFILEVRPNGMTYAIRYRNSHGKLKQFRISDYKSITYEKARQAAVRIRSQIVLGEDPSEERRAKRNILTLAEFAAEHYMPYIKTYKRSWECDDSLLRCHILKKFGAYHLDEIDTPAIFEFYHGMVRDGKARGTANRALVLLKFLYTIAKRMKLPGAEPNPTLEVKLVDPLNSRERYLSVDEAKRLYESVCASDNKMLRYIIPMLILTGARKREVLDAKWSDFDLARMAWRIPMTKSGVARHVPLSDGAINILQSIPRTDCEWTFSNPKTRLPYVSIFCSWNTARKQAGLADVRVHDLRHSFASLLINSGRTLYEVQTLLGHTQAKTTQRYAHLSPSTLLDASNAATRAVGHLFMPVAALAGIDAVSANWEAVQEVAADVAVQAV